MMNSCAECGKPLGSTGFICYSCQEDLGKSGFEAFDESVETLLNYGLVEPVMTQEGEPGIRMTEAGERFLEEIDGGGQ